VINHLSASALSFPGHQQLAPATGGTVAVGGAGVSITNTIVAGA
jgi:hypothetical protein